MTLVVAKNTENLSSQTRLKCCRPKQSQHLLQMLSIGVDSHSQERRIHDVLEWTERGHMNFPERKEPDNARRQATSIAFSTAANCRPYMPWPVCGFSPVYPVSVQKSCDQRKARTIFNTSSFSLCKNSTANSTR